MCSGFPSVIEKHYTANFVNIWAICSRSWHVAEKAGKSEIHIARNYLGQRRNFTGQQFWSRGYRVSTVGRDETMVREYIRDQEREDRRLDQLNMFK